VVFNETQFPFHSVDQPLQPTIARLATVPDTTVILQQ
jgi:hypothetical protein